MKEKDGLFDSIHDGRPERLAQLILVHALRTQARTREAVGLPVGAEAEVRVEQYTDDAVRTGWRADVVARNVRFELKLRAHFTPEQKMALARGEVSVIVIPSDRFAEVERQVNGLAKVFSWAAIASTVDDVATALLLRQADQMGNWLLTEASMDDVSRELSAYVEHGNGTWPQMYRFLSTLDAELTQRVPAYRAAGGWSHSRARKYYGYAFQFGEDRGAPSWWVGFVQDDGRTELAVFENDKRRATIGSVVVDEVVAQILALR